MHQRLTTCLLLCAGTAAAAGSLALQRPATLLASPTRCSLEPGTTRAVLQVEQDTTLPLEAHRSRPMSFSGVRPGPDDSLLTTPATRMPAARVRLLRLDSATRRILATEGITDGQPLAFIQAAPYRADCAPIRYTDSVPFAVRGEVGYVRAMLAPRGRWVGGVPLLVVPDVWYYPYPRRRSLAVSAAPGAPVAPAEALFSFETSFETSHLLRLDADSAHRSRVAAWARGNAAAAELEPLRTAIRRAVLEEDWKVASATPSRLRGTYRVEMEAGGQRSTWYFRTHDRPGYAWRGLDSLQSTARLLVFPYSPGYLLLGHAASVADSLPVTMPRPQRSGALVWLATNDMPTAPGNAARGILLGILEFQLRAAPESLWNHLEPFVPRVSARDSIMRARINLVMQREQKQPKLPITVRLDDRGGLHADTTVTANGRTVRVVLRRIDTLSIKQPW